MRWIVRTIGAVGMTLPVLLLVCSSATLSQETAGPGAMEALRDPSTQLTPDTVNALVSRLSDSQVRELLLERLDAIAASESQAVGMDIASGMQSLQGKVDLIRRRLKA